MLLILAAVLFGCALGALRLIPRVLLPWLDRLMAAGLALLLFSMGASIGGNPRLLGSLPALGAKSAVLAVGAVLGSVLAAWMLERRRSG